jgi:dTDP-4-dehydrorhamnose 3,5-epimerase
MKIVSNLLMDILLLKPTTKKENGIITSNFSNKDLNEIGISAKFVQENESFSYNNVLRGLHYQLVHPQGKLIRVVSGSIFDVVVDLRRSSPYFGKSVSYNLTAENGILAWIPPGYAHGFYVTSDKAKIIYNVTDFRFIEYEKTLLWSDKELGIKWPIGDKPPIISEKDAKGHFLKEFRDI